LDKIKPLFIIVALYVFINNPILVSLGGIGTIKILYLLAFAYLIFFKKLSELFNLFSKELLLFILIIVFSFVRAAFGGEISYVRTFIVSLIENIILTNFLAYILIKEPDSNWKTPIIHVGILGAIISTACFVSPIINIFTKTLQVSNDFIYESDFRNFGLAGELAFSYGITQGIILSLYLLNLKNNYHYVLFIPLFIISILFNARTGIFPVFCAILYLIFIERKFHILLIFWVVFLVSFLISENSQLVIKNEQTLEWVFDFFKQINDLVSGSNEADYNTTQTLLKDMLILPSNLSEWIVGSGVSSFRLQNNNSDVGFFLQLKYGGVVFATLLMLLFWTMIKRIYLFKRYGWYLFLLITVTVISNIKGDFIPNSGGFRLLFFIYVIIVHVEKLKTKNYFKVSVTDKSELFNKIGV
jgi:hypothetical protein